ncbi:MAG: hypothetical protein R2795_13365 [Saprospiraceae bacterium]
MPAGSYNYGDTGVEWNSDQRKLFTYTVGLGAGTFYNGNRQFFNLSARYRAQPWGNFTLAAEYNNLRFPDPYGKGRIWLVGPRVEINFSRNLFWTTFVQYNTQADNFNINSRLQWMFRPLSSLFVVYSRNNEVDIWQPRDQGLVVKVNYWLNL